MVSVKQIKNEVKLIFSILILSQLLLGGSSIAATKKLVSSDKNGPNFSEISTSSEQVILGKVKSTASRWVGKIIITTAEIEPLEILKGIHSKGPINVSYVGGRVGDIQQTLSHPLSLNEGETAILFLKDADKKSSLSGTKLFSHFDGKVPLLRKGEAISRLKTNDRLSSLIDELRKQVKEGE